MAVDLRRSHISFDDLFAARPAKILQLGRMGRPYAPTDKPLLSPFCGPITHVDKIHIKICGSYIVYYDTGNLPSITRINSEGRVGM